MNFLRIYMLRLKEFRWRNGKIAQNIPDINDDEWPQILSNCTNQEFAYIINLYKKPEAMMPNGGPGKKPQLESIINN